MRVELPVSNRFADCLTQKALLRSARLGEAKPDTHELAQALFCLQVPLYPESSVQVKLDSTQASEWQGDLLAIGLYEEDISEGTTLSLQNLKGDLAAIMLCQGPLAT